MSKMARKEPKRKFALWIRESSLDMTKEFYLKDNCGSQSEFIEKAIIFYCGYLASGEHNQYLPNVITSTLKGIVAAVSYTHLDVYKRQCLYRCGNERYLLQVIAPEYKSAKIGRAHV